jgi:TonB family protein
MKTLSKETAMSVSRHRVFTTNLIFLLAVTAALSVRAFSAPAQAVRVRVGAQAAAANLVSQVKPVYPPEARAARVQGEVMLQIVIGTDGKVIEVAVVRGHALLNESAVDAVSQWLYRPFLLNGQPVEVITTVTVNYSFQ